MPGLPTAVVIGLLNDLRADLRPELTVTAAGRSAGIAAAAAATATTAAAITELGQKICPLTADLDRLRADARWHDVRSACDLASQYAAGVAGQIGSVATEALLVVTDMEPVHYQGSITERHGTQILAGPCHCRRCGSRRGRLRLCSLLNSHLDLNCVRPRSVTATALDEPVNLPTDSLETVLREAITALPSSVPTGHAVTLLRSMSLFTGRTRVVVAAWSHAIEQRLSGKYITALDGMDPMTCRDRITNRLGQASTELGPVQDELHRASETLRAIDAGPPLPPAPH